jgi:molecular chaperone GrpE
LRAIADYQNLQKETALQRGEWVRMSELQIIEEFLPVYSNFRKAFAHANEGSGIKDQGSSWLKGIEYIMKQFGDVLKAHGVEEIKTVGEMLDTTKHEAVGEEEVEDVEPGKIIREVETGYMMKGKVVRVAKVVVAK